MSDLKIHKAPEDFKPFSVWWAGCVQKNVNQQLYFCTDVAEIALTDKNLQEIIEETKEFYDKLINLRDSLNKDK